MSQKQRQPDICIPGVGQDSLEKQNQHDIYINKDLLQGISSHDYGSWEVPRPQERADGLVLAWVQRSKNEESQWYKFQSEIQQAWNTKSVDVSVPVWR